MSVSRKSANGASLASGSRVGRYTVLELLGAGGMGEVYRARDDRLNRDVALKVLPRQMARESGRVARFLDEIRLVSALDHPNVVAVFDAGHARGMPFAVSEMLRGETLRARIRSSELDLREALGIATQIARGLSAAHAGGVLHRDLKPENVFITRAGNVKILDFGIARLADVGTAGAKDDTVEEPARISGTASYMAPEQIRGEREDARTDIFAFGAVLYEMVTGRRAFTGANRAEIMAAVLTSEPAPVVTLVPGVPTLLAKVIHRCLAKPPGSRFHDVDDVIAVLELVATEAHGTDADRPPVRPRPSRRRLPLPLGLAFLAGLVLGAASRPGRRRER